MRPPVYFDTLALAKLILEERGSSDLRDFVTDSNVEVVSSEIAEVELIRAVMRTDERLMDTVLEILPQTVLLPISTPIRLRASQLPPPSLRSLDALHLATAIEIQPHLQAFVSYDQRLLDSAAEAGLSVFSPGL